MREHYQFSEDQYNSLLNHGVTAKDLFKSVSLFDPFDTKETINKIGLLYYIDKKGDFNEGAKFPHKKIAKVIFDNLNIKDKIMIAEYIELKENNWIEVED